MTFLRVLVEGESDVPVVREIMTRRLRRREYEQFVVLTHGGKGRRRRRNSSRGGLLDVLPTRLRAFAAEARTKDVGVVVLVDADDEDCMDLKRFLLSIQPRPRKTLFRIAVEEIESWFLADREAIRRSFPKAKLRHIPKGAPDRVVGASECLARVLDQNPKRVLEMRKRAWAAAIAPNLDLNNPKSPSLREFIVGVERLLVEGELQ